MNARSSIAVAPGESRGQRAVASRRRFRFRREYYGLLFVIPAMAFFLIFNIYPMFSGLYYSLTRFTLLKPPVFVGFDNFVKLLADKQFQNAAFVTFAYVVGTTVPQPLSVQTGLQSALLHAGASLRCRCFSGLEIAL